jgi:nitrogen PTS system EIIA component
MLSMKRGSGAVMKISDLLVPENVLFDVRATTKRSLLEHLAFKAASTLGLSADQVTAHLLKREDLGSTGIGRGVAVPHARVADLQLPYGLLAKLKQPIEFDAIDGQSVDIVFVLLLPAAAESGHVRALALVARAFRSSENLDRLRRAKNASELYSLIGATQEAARPFRASA